MVYNLSIIADNSTSLLGFTQGVNNVLLDGWLGVLILVGLTLVFFTSYVFVTKNDDFIKAASGALFMSFLFSILLWAMGLLSTFIVLVVLILFSGTLPFRNKS